MKVGDSRSEEERRRRGEVGDGREGRKEGVRAHTQAQGSEATETERERQETHRQTNSHGIGVWSHIPDKTVEQPEDIASLHLSFSQRSADFAVRVCVRCVAVRCASRR
eukprot:531226-Rhodomonas_salina.2